MLAVLLVVCSSGCASASAPSGAGETTAAASDTTTAADTASAAVNWESSGLPKEDFGGVPFTILYGGGEPVAAQSYRFVDVADLNGEVLNDAIYNRNMKIGDLYNVDIGVVYSSAFDADVKAAVNSGDASYAAVFGGANVLITQEQSNLLQNWYKLPYTDLTKEWWDQTVVEGLTIYGKLYMCTGDISPLTNVRVYSLVFNKDLCRELGLEMPYKHVLDGTWTIDVFSKYISDVNNDVNGDGKMDYDDRWGYFSQDGNSYMMYFSGGGQVTSITADGGRELSFNTERNVSLAIKALEVSIDKTKTLMANTYVSQNGGQWSAASFWFAAGGSLMRSSVFEPVPRDYRAMDTDFGVLPYPKLDEAQERYYTLPETTSYMFAVPTTSDPRMASLVLEALAAESVSTVSSAFYDVCLNGKVVRDEESKAMLDIIFGSKVFDVGYFLNIASITSTLQGLETKGSTDIASAFEKNTKAAEKTLSKALENIKALD
jgi:hypothetical protein